MKIRTLLSIVFIALIGLTSCKKEVEKQEVKKEIVAADLQTVSLKISGMTCEIGCAKTIQSKLNKKEGVAEAKVVFTDSIATIKYDAKALEVNDLISFIDGIAGGDLYKASEATE